MATATPAAARAAAAPPVTRRPRAVAPTLRVERRLLRNGVLLLASMDEVGRGAPAGPVHVGVVVIHAATPPAPVGVRDSKLLTASARQALVPMIERWAVDAAVGGAGADEVDAFGVVGALRCAGQRALAALMIRPDLVLLDGSYDWLTEPGPGTGVPGVSGVSGVSGVPVEPGAPGVPVVPVITRVRADLTCASVAAASILAKVHRDAVMTGLDLDYPGYGLGTNKGYGTADHFGALRRLGPSPQHRMSWNLPGRV